MTEILHTAQMVRAISLELVSIELSLLHRQEKGYFYFRGISDTFIKQSS